ncbi:MAG: hypothetical protein H6672_18850 [Anaerolineaceae bacterium]|nr:hypothetical protein [Anaerolineaceae bacterium]
MDSQKTNIVAVVLMLLVLVFFVVLAVTGWASGGAGQGMVTSALAGLVAIALVTDLKKGVRAPTPFERFKLWMNFRPVIIGGGGLTLMALVGPSLLSSTTDWPLPIKLALVFIPVLTWAGAVFYTIWRAPHRYETDIAYKKRIGYRHSRDQ